MVALLHRSKHRCRIGVLNAMRQHSIHSSAISQWHHPALYILIAVGVLFYVILALVLSKSATIHVGLCETHAASRKRDIFITCVLVLLSFVSFYFAVATEQMMLLFAGLMILLGAAIYGIVKARVVAPQKIDDQYVWLTGINANYLQQFPEWRASR
jgi:hypothetical protein